jgi:glutathione synthase/RimK-type ligase-like ATP-grasp enzyme
VRLALATSSDLPDGDPDDARLPETLGGEFRVWDDPGVDWAGYDLVLVRSTWDYVDRREEFLAWAASVPRILNPPSVLRWNTDKRYLAELALTGLPVVPTTFVEPGGAVELPDGEVVVKPAVSAGARDTARHDDPAAARAHVERLLARGATVMVQPYLARVDEEGETGLVFFGGAYSHAFSKGPLLARGEAPRDAPELVGEEIGAREPAPEQLALAERVVAAAQERLGPLAYARVDILPGPEGPVLIELELTEPSLWFCATSGGEERLARALQDLP